VQPIYLRDPPTTDANQERLYSPSGKIGLGLDVIKAGPSQSREERPIPEASASPPSEFAPRSVPISFLLGIFPLETYSSAVTQKKGSTQ